MGITFGLDRGAGSAAMARAYARPKNFITSAAGTEAINLPLEPQRSKEVHGPESPMRR